MIIVFPIVLSIKGIVKTFFLDMIMPRMYGHELYDEIKKIDNEAKACLMTATYQNYEVMHTVSKYRNSVLYSKTS